MNAPRLLRPASLDSDQLDASGRWPRRTIWRVLTAAREGDVQELAALLAEDQSLVHARYWYTAPMHFAVREGHLDATRLLVEAGASLTEARGLYGEETLLQTALDREHAEVAAYLREQLEARHSSGGDRHAIHERVAAGDWAEVERLLEQDPSLADRGDPRGRRPLHYAVEAGSRPWVDLLLDRGAEIDAAGFSSDNRLGGDGFRPVVLALWHHPYWRQRNDYSLARHLLDRGAEYTATVAAALGDEERTRALLQSDSSLANQAEPGGKRPLSAAAERNHLELVELLLEHGADPNLPEGENCPGGYALWAASHFGHREVAERLLEAGADPNADVDSSGTPTEAASDETMRALLYRHGGRLRPGALFYYNHLDTIAALLDAKPEMFGEAEAAEGFAYSVTQGHEEMLRLLLARGLRVPKVVTPCQSYLWHDLKLARLLLESGMDPNLPNWQQIRPLHHMAAAGQIEAAKLFLEFGADPNALDEEYRSTPLGWAARRGQTEFARFFLSARSREGSIVDPAAPSSPTWARPIEWARRRGHAEIEALLSGR